MDKNSLAHTSWNCKYHIVFAPKYRRQVIYGKLKQDIGKTLRDLCERKGINIIEAECCPDHIHMLLEIPPKYSVSQIMEYLKGNGNRHFWYRGYYVDTTGKNAKNPRIYQKSIGERPHGGSDKHERIHRSVYGSAGQIKYETRRFSANWGIFARGRNSERESADGNSPL